MTYASIVLVAAVILGVVVPWVVVRMFVPTLEGVLQARRTNYAGRTVFIGLGAVWIVWSVALFVLQPIVDLCSELSANSGSAVPVIAFPPPAVAAALAAVACSLGMVDDAFGTGDDRGFKGHFRALASGRISTGMLKLVGISAMSVAAAYWLVQSSGTYVWPVFPNLGALPIALLAGAAIALTSNFVNLTDLRPGRALKAYLVLAVIGAVVSGSLVLGIGTFGMVTLPQMLSAAVWLILVLGPVVAVWGYDLGERGMLGDAGANAMGAVAGLLVVAGLPMWGVAIYALVMLALNLLSERVSFSRVIDSTPPLRWLDGLGRTDRPTRTSDKPETSNQGDVSEG